MPLLARAFLRFPFSSRSFPKRPLGVEDRSGPAGVRWGDLIPRAGGIALSKAFSARLTYSL
jgi:hypothetical protein